MNRSSRKSLLTIRERVILHLLTYQKFYQDADAPVAVTQEGIAESVEVGRNNISKIVNTLSNEQIVDVQVKHVKGFASVKRVYFLTPSGFQNALEIKAEVESSQITIIDFDGKAHEETIGKLAVYLPKRYSFLEMALGVSRGRFECSSFHEGKIRQERRFVDYTDRKPAVRSFYGRQEEMRKLSDFLTSETAHVMAVCGIPGIGKTTLLAKFVQDVREHRNVFWYRIHEWVNLKALLSPIAEFLSQLGIKGLERYLSRTETPNVGEVCTIMESELKDLPAVFILDDTQKADSTVQAFLSALVDTLDSLPKVSIICTSREIPSFYTRSAVFKGLVVELMLEGLDKESSFRLMRERELPEKDLMDIYLATRGHPLFMDLVDNPRNALGKNVRMFIEQEVYSKLDLCERRILEIASIFRYPVLIDAFFTIEEEVTHELDGSQKEMDYESYMVDYDTIDALQAKSLLHESVGRMIGMHDLLRDFFYSRLSPRQRLTYHKAASRYYSQDPSPPSRIEALYHCLMAKEYSMAIRIAAAHGREIIAKGYSLPFAPLLATLRSQCDRIEKSEKMEILLLEGDIMDIRGEWDGAISRFQEVASLASPEVDKRVLAEVNRRIGVIYLRRVDFDHAEACFQQSLGLAQDIKDTQTLSETFYDLGGMMQTRGRTKEAIDSYSKSKELAQANGDSVGMGKALYGMGRVYRSMADHQKALRIEKEALEVIERTGDVNELAKVHIGLGGVLSDMGSHAEAVKSLERGIELGRTSGNLDLQGYAMANIAAAFIELGDLPSAEEMVTTATKIWEKLNNQMLMADMHLLRGYIYCKKTDWEWAKDEFGTAISMVRHLDAPLVLSMWLLQVAQEYAKNGERGEARNMLNEALEISTEEATDSLRREIEAALEKICA